MLNIKNLSKEYILDREKIIAIENVNFEVSEGEFFTVIGKSGCGKSTLLRLIAKLDKPTSGKITWDNPPKIGFVFQNFALFPFLTVFQNIEFGLKMQGVEEKERKKTVESILVKVGLEESKDKHPIELSGGMKQRVGIARSLAINPNVLLLDEPFSSLDEFTAESLRNLLLRIWEEEKITIILITHLITEAVMLSDKIAVMSPAPGTIEKIINNSLSRPRNTRSEGFFSLEDELKNLIKF